MHFSAMERETIINFADDSREVSIYSRSPVVLRKLDRLCIDFPEVYQVESRNEYQGDYICKDKRLITIRKTA